MYGAISLAGTVLYCIGFACFVFGSIRASRQIHEKLAQAMLGATLYFLDRTPIGRIIARFTQDMRAIDETVPSDLQALVERAITIIVKYLGIVYLSPVFLLPGVMFGAAGGWLGNIYIHAQVSTSVTPRKATERSSRTHSYPLNGMFSI